MVAEESITNFFHWSKKNEKNIASLPYVFHAEIMLCAKGQKSLPLLFRMPPHRSPTADPGEVFQIVAQASESGHFAKSFQRKYFSIK